MVSRARLIPIVAFFVVLVAAYWSAPKKSVEAQITQCLGRCCCQPDLGYLPEVLDDLVRGTGYEGNYQINSRPRTRVLNIYFMCKTPSSPLKAFSGGCFYIPSSTPVIVCDKSFIDEYYNYFTTVPGPQNPAFARSLDSFAKPLMVNWFLGHEVGHAVQDPGSGHLAFDGKEPRCTDLRFDKGRELEADSFVVERGINESMPADPTVKAVRLFAFTAILWAVIDKEADRYGPATRTEKSEHSPFWLRTDTVRVPDMSCSHPPLIIRAVRLLDAITKRVELAKEQRPRFENTQPRIKYLGEQDGSRWR